MPLTSEVGGSTSGFGAAAAGTVLGVEACVAEACGRRCGGVPARAAHPGCAGPDTNQVTSASGNATEPIANATRPGAHSPHPAAIRHTTAAATAPIESATRPSIHGRLASLPVPSAWNNATPHNA